MNTVKTEIIFDNLLTNGGKMKTLAESMRMVGYSESYVRNPQKIKKTRAWKETSNKVINNEATLVLKLYELFNSKRITHKTFPISLSDEEIADIFNNTDYKVINIKKYTKGKFVTLLEPDYQIQLKALDMVYKILGRYP